MKIITDSAADLTPEDIKTFNITVAPLYIQFPEGEVTADSLTPDEFYERLEKMQPEAPTTAQPSAGNFAELYEKLVASGDELLSIHISSGLSGTLNAAVTGAKMLEGNTINVVDSMTLSGGQRFQVLAAALCVKAGWSVEDIKTHMVKVRDATEVIYTLDTLNYLMRGGRIGRVQALASALLNIKPIIHVDRKDGAYSTVAKSRTIKRALADITSHLHNIYTDQPVWVSVMHGRFEEKAHDLAESIQSTLNVAKLEILRISPVLGVHTGPGIVGATVAPMHLFEEIQ